MNVYEEIKRMLGIESNERKMYQLLNTEHYRVGQYCTSDIEEDMALVKQSINGWWKPRYIVDNACQKAYEFMDESEHLLTITDDDIVWESLQSLPEKIVARAKAHSGHFPVLFRRFHNGEADVIWQINPDGRYYMDDDGFGMTDDEEIALVGTVDRTGKVIRKFKYNG